MNEYAATIGQRLKPNGILTVYKKILSGMEQKEV